ncbi:MAG: glycosyltransferase family 4 protein [Clostridia bacterium]|nr:glycosyltransferase family 4 protein [Clostridia bacterium]
METIENVKNIYLFPHRAKANKSVEWINALNENETIAYIQEENIIKTIFLLKRILKEHKVTHIFRHFYDIKIDAILKIVCYNKPVVRFCHGMYADKNATGIMHKVRNFLWGKDFLIGVSEAVSESYRHNFNNVNIHTVDNAIFFDRLNVVDEFQKQDKVSLMCMGYNIKTKGTDIAIAMAQKLHENYDFVLNIVVAANDEELEKYLKSVFVTIPEWINVLPPVENIATYFNANDIFLSPSRSEAFGYAVVEAAYCKNSIVASKTGGQGQLKIDGVYWFESENLDDFYVKTELAVKELNSGEKNLQKENAAKSVQNAYSLDEWRNAVINLVLNKLR